VTLRSSLARLALPFLFVSLFLAGCATSPYLVGAGSTEPAFTNPNPPTCTTTINKRKPPGGSPHFLIPYSSFLISHFPPSPVNMNRHLDEYRPADIFYI